MKSNFCFYVTFFLRIIIKITRNTEILIEKPFMKPSNAYSFIRKHFIINMDSIRFEIFCSEKFVKKYLSSEMSICFKENQFLEKIV